MTKLRFETPLRAKDEVLLRRVTGQVVAAQTGRELRRVRVFLLGHELFVLDPLLEELRAPLRGIEATSGDVEIQVDLELTGGWQGLAVIVGTVEAPEELQQLRPDLISELSRIGPDIAADLVGQIGKSAVNNPLSLLVRLDRLEGFERELSTAAAGIRAVARTTQARTVERRRWRPGSSPKRILSARYGASVLPNGEVAIRPEVLTTLRTTASTDVEEHRQFARGVALLRRHAFSLRRSVEAVFDDLHELAVPSDAQGLARKESLSEQELSRIRGVLERLRMARGRTSVVARRAQQLQADERWLQGVGEPRTVLTLTPTFLRVGAYARAFDTLRALFDFDTSADKSPVERFKTTPELFEIWVFIACVRVIYQRLCPENRDGIEAQLAEIRRGDVIDLDWGIAGRMLIILEPIIEGKRGGQSGGDLPYRAALTSSNLRPDIWIEWRGPNGPSRAAVIDAKCTSRFRRGRHSSGRSAGDELEQMRDYRSRVVDPITGRQPVRGMFQVHYAAGEPILCNVRQLMLGTAPVDAFITGAVGATPGRTAHLESVVIRLLEWLMKS